MLTNNIPIVIVNLIKSYIPKNCCWKDCSEIGTILYIPNIFEGDPWYDRCQMLGSGTFSKSECFSLYSLVEFGNSEGKQFSMLLL